MKRYLWVLLLAACTAPTGEVTKAVKTNTETKELLQTKSTRGTELSETGTKKPDPEEVKTEITGPEATDNSKKTEEKKTLTGTYFGIRKLNFNEYEIDENSDDDGVDDRRLALVFDADGKAGWGDAENETQAKEKAKQKGYIYDVNGDTITVKKDDGTTLLVLELRDNNQFIYITQDKTSKVSPLKESIDYKNTGLALNGKEVKNSGHGGAAGTRVEPPIPKYH